MSKIKDLMKELKEEKNRRDAEKKNSPLLFFR